MYTFPCWPHSHVLACPNLITYWVFFHVKPSLWRKHYPQFVISCLWRWLQPLCCKSQSSSFYNSASQTPDLVELEEHYPPTHDPWIKEVWNNIKLEKLRFSLKGLIKTFQETWIPFLGYVDSVNISPDRGEDWSFCHVHTHNTYTYTHMYWDCSKNVPSWLVLAVPHYVMLHFENLIKRAEKKGSFYPLLSSQIENLWSKEQNVFTVFSWEWLTPTTPQSWGGFCEWSIMVLFVVCLDGTTERASQPHLSMMSIHPLQ